MAQPLGSEDHRVVIELSEVFARLLRECPGAARGEGHAALVGASGIRGQISSPMGGADLEPGKAIERSSKIRCDRAIVVSSGLPITFSSTPLPLSRPEVRSSAEPCG